MTRLELLAPAKNILCGKAAIDHGADAVYIGAPRFGARASAGNSVEDIAELCQYAHQFGAKVFVTVNTIIYDEELQDTLSLIRQLCDIHVDALLVQDMGLVSLLGTTGCALHASTQTDNRSVEKVKWLASLGFRRIVLARELSVEEIEAIHKAVPDVELEVFVHGALCVSYSGQCYASQHCFGRSANRGECAQFCRLAFDLKDADGRIIEQDSHVLSLRDMNQLDNLERLAEAGAVSFKIEGRLKDVDYVKNVTSAYSLRLDEIIAKNPGKYTRASFGRIKYGFTPDVSKSFNRNFTSYFADGRSSASLACFETPKAKGEFVGKVKEIRGRSFNVAGTASFTNGDGLCFVGDNRQLVGFRVNKVEGNRIFPLRIPKEIRPGLSLYRNYDQAFNAILAKPTAERLIEVTMHLGYSDEKVTLTVSDAYGHSVDVSESITLDSARTPQRDNQIRQITKLGNTTFVCENAIIDDATPSLFIPSSLLAQLRRDAITALSETIVSAHVASIKPSEVDITRGTCPPSYAAPYLYNAANKNAKLFYESKATKATAFETDGNPSDNILMQCRYCLRNELGYCTKSGKRASWREPLSLSLPDGREFPLHFDCKNCQMNVLRQIEN